MKGSAAEVRMLTSVAKTQVWRCFKHMAEVFMGFRNAFGGEI
jgi:hypothetical protein